MFVVLMSVADWGFRSWTGNQSKQTQPALGRDRGADARQDKCGPELGGHCLPSL